MQDASPPPRSGSVLTDRLIMALLVGTTAWLSLSLARVPGSVAAVWIGNGIFVGWLLSRPTALWPGYLAAGFAAEFLMRQLYGDALLSGTALSVSNLIEVLIVAGLVRHLVPDVGDPKGWLGLGGIATGSTLAACAVSGLLAATVFTLTSDAPFLANFLIWFCAHVVGMVVVATLTLVVRREGLGLVDIPGRGLDFAGCMLLLIAVSVAVFSQTAYPLLFLSYPPLLLGVFRHRFAGVVVGVSLLAIIGSVATALGHGPLVMMRMDSVSNIERFILLQLFIGTACVMAFPVALAMAERGRLTARMRESEQRYRMLADYSHDVVLRVRQDGRRLYVSPSAKEMMGWEPGELREMKVDVVHPEDRAARQQVLDTVITSGKPGTAIYRVLHKDGHYLWVESIAQAIPSTAHDGTMDIIFAARDISRRVAAEQALEASRRELEILARVDSLTGLANRRQFDERLALALTRLHRLGLPVALMYLDIDHFKQINDGFGHAAGDEVLRTFARRLTCCVRAGDLVARLGGDEFVVLIEDAALPEAAAVIARKLLAAMGAGIPVDASTVAATTSIGIAFSTSTTSSQQLMEAADAALYTAKKAGRNTYRVVTVDGAPRSPAAV